MNKFLIFVLSLVFFLKQILFLNANNDTYINTTNIIYDEEKNIIELAENSKINIGDTNILIDRGIIDYDNDNIEIYGNFYLYQELNILSGKDLVGDTKLNNFTAYEVSYIYNNDLKIDSEEAKRKKDFIYFYNNFLTPCKLEGYFNCPTWSLRIDETRYDINKDKFNHFDTFLQIADYKVFYLPYFSHYGAKAPRQRGFLPPTLEISLVGADTGLITPYYIPISDQSDIIFKPKISFNTNFEYTENFSLQTFINNKNSGGDISLELNTSKLKKDNNVYNSAKINARQVLNKKNILTYRGIITNSISETRSNNEEPITFEDIFVRLDSYDIFSETDYLKSELSTVEAFDSTKEGLIPLSPSVEYKNNYLSKNSISFTNKLNLTNLQRNESKIDKPSESLSLKIDNTLMASENIGEVNFYNKVKLMSHIGNYDFNHNPNLNDNVISQKAILSSDIFYNLSKNIQSRVKFIKNLTFISDNIINENSKAFSFNYLNQFSDSRLYGTDLDDNTSRVIYGLENKIFPMGKKIDVNISQSYDFVKNTNYTSQINQTSNLSDIALEAKTNFDQINLKVDTRLSNNQLEKREMNYSINYSNNFNLGLVYNETDKSAFKGLSSDTQSLGMKFEKKVNDNVLFSINSDLDLKNNYSPYSQTFSVSLLDDCSRLDLSYKDERFNDNYNTQPNETISLRFSMDYLGFFGYEQKSNLFFEEPGSFNYGL